MTKLTRCLVVGVLLLAACSSASHEATRAPTTSATVAGAKSLALSDEGRLLWNFEALLHATFGNADVSSDVNDSFSDYYATCGTRCGPSAEHPGYAYTFQNASGSAFHIAKKPLGPDVVFGAHPVPVLIRNLPVTCNAAGTKYLVIYGDTASFTLGCLPAR